MSKKPTPLRKELGADVTITVNGLQKDADFNNVLHRIGKEYAKMQPGMEYQGTICMMIYKENDALAKNTYSLSNITNIAMEKDISENAMLTLWQNAAIRIRSYFNPAFQHKTTDSKDKRGTVL